MPKYTEKPREIEARQLDMDNGQELADWCGGMLVEEIDAEDPSKTQPGINVPTPGGTFRASVGTYILRHDNGSFSIMGPSAFQDQYEVVR